LTEIGQSEAELLIT